MEVERGSTRSHSLGNSLWKRLWTCRWLSIYDVTRFWLKIGPTPRPVTFRHKIILIFQLQNDVTTYASPPKPQENELSTGSICHYLKPQQLPVNIVLLRQKSHKKNVHSLGLQQKIMTDRLLPPSSTAGELPVSRNMGSVASSAQNHTGCIKTFVTSLYFEPSPPSFFTQRHKSIITLPL